MVDAEAIKGVGTKIGATEWGGGVYFFCEFIGLLGFEKESIFALTNNIERSAVVGGDNGGVHGEGFDEGESKAFGFFRAGDDAVAQGINFGDTGLPLNEEKLLFNSEFTDELLEFLVVFLFVVAGVADDESAKVWVFFYGLGDGVDEGFVVFEFGDAADGGDDHFSIEIVLFFKGFDPSGVEFFWIESGGINAGVDDVDAVVGGLVVLLDVGFNGVADADHSVAPSHDFTVGTYAIKAVDAGDEGIIFGAIGKVGDPRRNPTVGVDERGVESLELGAESVNAGGKGEWIFRAEVEGDVLPAVTFNGFYQRATRRNDDGLVSAFNEFAVEVEHHYFNTALLKFGNELNNFLNADWIRGWRSIFW